MVRLQQSAKGERWGFHSWFSTESWDFLTVTLTQRIVFGRGRCLLPSSASQTSCEQRITVCEAVLCRHPSSPASPFFCGVSPCSSILQDCRSHLLSSQGSKWLFYVAVLEAYRWTQQQEQCSKACPSLPKT